MKSSPSFILCLTSVAVVVLSMCVPYDANASSCSTPVSEVLLNSVAGVDLPGITFGSDIVAMGAYVMALFTNASGTYSQLSFNYGSTFPPATVKTLLNVPIGTAKMNLVTDGKDVLAIGSLQNKVQSFDFSFGDFSWSTNSSVLFNGTASFVGCGGKRGLIVCAVANNPAIAEGMQIYSYNTNQLNRAALVWQKRASTSTLPTTLARPGVASDGTSFMVCSVGTSGTLKLICSFSVNGTLDYSPTPTQPFVGTPPGNEDVVVASSGVTGTYVVAFVNAGTIQNMITLNNGTTWTTGAVMFPGSTVLPFAITFTNTFIGVSQQGASAFRTFENNSSPLQWSTPAKLVDGTKVSFASGHFATNSHYAFKNASGVFVRSCIPTAGPTVAPSPSPTKLGGGSVHLELARSIVILTAIAAVLTSFY